MILSHAPDTWQEVCEQFAHHNLKSRNSGFIVDLL